LVGLATNNFDDTDEAKITQYLNGTFSPEIEFEKSVHDVRGKKVGILLIHSSKRKPVIAIKDDVDIKQGEVYYRYIARSEKIKFPELRKILDQIQENERKHWMALFERIATIGAENTAIMNVASGKIDGSGGTVVIDHKLLPKLRFIKEGSFQERGRPVLKLIGDVKPVSFTGRARSAGSGIKITNDPNAPTVRLEEKDMMSEFPLDYQTLTSRLRTRYWDFSADAQYHKVRKELIAKGFAITRKLNPNKPDGTAQTFYMERIIKEFDKTYSKK
jgi:hypothetical protein